MGGGGGLQTAGGCAYEWCAGGEGAHARPQRACVQAGLAPGRAAAARVRSAGGFRPAWAEKAVSRGPVSRLACEGDGTARQRLTREVGRGEQERLLLLVESS